MTLFSQVLKDEHSTLLSLLSKMQKMDSESSQGREHFSLTKFMLFEHLKKEDDYLYPALKQFEQKGLLKSDRFSSEMIELAEYAKEFFKKCDKGMSSQDFSMEFGQFIATLKKRIIREETTLFPLYDELSAQVQYSTG